MYSFGVVLLEMLCGWRHFDRFQLEEAMHLQGLFMEKLLKKQLLDLVDKYHEDMRLHGSEVVDMMRVAAWCSQSDYSKRPSMLMVVKVLEGVGDVEENTSKSYASKSKCWWCHYFIGFSSIRTTVTIDKNTYFFCMKSER